MNLIFDKTTIKIIKNGYLGNYKILKSKKVCVSFFHSILKDNELLMIICFLFNK